MDYDSRTPIYLQVADILKKRMVQGGIRPGDKLPSTRALANSLAACRDCPRSRTVSARCPYVGVDATTTMRRS